MTVEARPGLRRRLPDSILNSGHSTGNTDMKLAFKKLEVGIGAKLYVAFGFTAAMTVVATMIAWFGYGSVGQTLEDITTRNIPQISGSLKLAKESAGLAAAAPELVAVGSQEERMRVKKTLDERANEMKALIAEISKGDSSGETQKIEQLGTQISDQLNGLDSQVKASLEYTGQRQKAVAGLNNSHKSFLNTLAPIVDDVNFELVMAGENTIESSEKVISGLMTNEVTMLTAGLEASKAVEQVYHLISAVLREQDTATLTIFEERLTAALHQLAGQLDNLPDVETTKTLRMAAKTLSELAGGKDNVVNLRRQQLDKQDLTPEARKQLAAQHAGALATLKKAYSNFNETVAPLIDDANFNLATGSEDVVDRIKGSIGSLLEKGVGELRSILDLQAEANLIAGLLGAAANEPTAARIQPIRERFTAAAAHFNEALGNLPDSDQNKGVRAQAATLLSYGQGEDSLFDLRFKELELQEALHDRLRASRELSDQLSASVASLVKVAEQAAADASVVSAEITARNKVILLVIALASVLIASVIAWWYVGGRVIKR